MKHYHFALKFIFLSGIVMIIYHFQVSVVSLGDSDEDDYENQKLDAWGAFKELLVLILHYSNQFILHIFTRVHCLLISMVTIQRFLIYFFPSTEPYVNLEQNTMATCIKWVYAVTAVFVLFFLVVNVFEVLPVVGERKVSPYIYYYFSLDALFFLSSLLYIPIMISIRKHSHLSSVIQNKPQKYVLYQCLICLIFRTAHYPLMCFLYVYLEYRIDMIIEFAIEMDFLNTPLIVQVSYLFCNKRNVETLFSRNLFRLMFCMDYSGVAQVGPTPVLDLQSTSVPAGQIT